MLPGRELRLLTVDGKEQVGVVLYAVDFNAKMPPIPPDYQEKLKYAVRLAGGAPWVCGGPTVLMWGQLLSRIKR